MSPTLKSLPKIHFLQSSPQTIDKALQHLCIETMIYPTILLLSVDYKKCGEKNLFGFLKKYN